MDTSYVSFYGFVSLNCAKILKVFLATRFLVTVLMRTVLPLARVVHSRPRKN